MLTLSDLFKNLRRLDLNDFHVQDSLYRISDWLYDDEHKKTDEYVQKQLEFLNNLIKQAEKDNKFYVTKDNGVRIVEEYNKRLNEKTEDILNKINEFKNNL